jgi:hypothetical protein
MTPEQTRDVLRKTAADYRRASCRPPSVTLAKGHIEDQFARNVYTFTVATITPDGTIRTTAWEMRVGRPGLRCLMWQGA